MYHCYRLDNKLTNVVFNPVAMEYMTQWDQVPRPKSAVGPRGGKSHLYSGRYQSPKKTGYSSSPPGYEKTSVPFGQLSVRDLVRHVEQARRQSPYYEEFKHNDPILIGTPSASISSSSISMCSSKEFYGDNGVISMQPVIPNLKLLTPGLDHSDTDHEQHSRQVKRMRRHSERPMHKRAGKLISFNGIASCERIQSCKKLSSCRSKSKFLQVQEDEIIHKAGDGAAKCRVSE